MDPQEQRTSTIVVRIYDHLLTVKEERLITHYIDCFRAGFDIPYESRFCHYIMERRVVNNIPYILGAIGHTCNDFELPPLCCLVVAKGTRQCGKGVVTSRDGVADNSRFAEEVDRPALYECNDYPQSGSPQAQDFLNRVMVYLRQECLTRE